MMGGERNQEPSDSEEACEKNQATPDGSGNSTGQ